MSAENRLGKDRDIVEIIARVLAGKIKKEDLSEQDKWTLDFYGPGGVMEDDYEFGQKVYARKDQILEETQNQEPKEDNKPIEFVNRNIGRRVPLYTSDELKNAKRHKKHKTGNNEPAIQPRLWESESSQNDNPIDMGSVFDKDKKFFKEIRKLDSRFHPRKKTVLNEEIKHKNAELREIIGLPVARGNSEYVKDKFYRYLVRRIYTNDAFEIFADYDRVIDKPSEELGIRIQYVKNLVNELLHGGLNRFEKYQKFDNSYRECVEKWGIEPDSRYFREQWI